MARSCVVMDEMVREYLLFRGFTKTAQALESEIKFDKDKNMRADKITEHLLSFVYGFDLAGLKDYWSYLNKRFFKKIPNTAIHKTLIKLEDCLLKYYLVNAHQSQKHDKVVEFFERFAGEMLGTTGRETWRDWFAFPYIKSPELHPVFGPYFQRIWSETVHMSLQNLVSTVLDALPLPALLHWKEGSLHETEEKQLLQKEVSVLKMKLQDNTHTDSATDNLNKSLVTRSDMEIAEDFYIISAGRSPGGNDLTQQARSPLGAEHMNLALPSCKIGSFTSMNCKDYREHSSPVVFAQFSCEGMFCATSDTNGVLKIWAFSPDIKTLHSYIYKSGVYSLHWARKQDKLLYVGTGSSTVKVINISNRRNCQELVHPTEHLRVVSLASNLASTHLVSAATDTEFGVVEFLVWDCKSREILQILEISPVPSPITSTHFNHNGNLLVSGALDGMIRVYADLQCVMGWQAHSSPVLTVKFSVDENTVFSYCQDGTLCQWRLYPMSQCLHTVTVHPHPHPSSHYFGRDFALDSDGKYLIAARGFQPVIYSIENGIKEDSVLPSQGSPVASVDWHVPYSTRLCLAATGGGLARITGLLQS